MVVSWYDSGARLDDNDDNESVNAAFSTLQRAVQQEEEIASELGRLSLPDVPLWLVFEDLAQPIVLPGSATTSALHAEAARVHNVRSRAIGLGTPTNLPNPCPQPWNRSC
jgi:hypothetical protein